MSRLQQLVGAMKAEIVLDMYAGRVPKRVHTVEQLHDYVDANLYGSSIFGQWPDFIADNNRAVKLLNAANEVIDEWLLFGLARRSLATYRALIGTERERNTRRTRKGK